MAFELQAESLMKTIFSCLLLIFNLTQTFASEVGSAIEVINRQDSVVYKIRLNYYSSWKKNDLNYILNPKNNRIHELFSDPIHLTNFETNKFKVKTSVEAIFTIYEIQNVLNYNTKNSLNTSFHSFHFSEFDHLFEESNIEVKVIQEGDRCHVKVEQVAVIKLSAYKKIKLIPGGISMFKKRILANLSDFQNGTGKIK
jgi:hypothetical protein